MASGRILNKKTLVSPLSGGDDSESAGRRRGIRGGLNSRSKLPPLHHLLLFSLICVILAGCGTAGSVRKGPALPPPDESGKEAEANEELRNTLDENRSELDDVYARDNDIPAYFLANTSPDNKRNIGNPYTGFRVQIISTRDMAKAKKIANNFRVWADKHIIGYSPQAYLTFDQPYYKVHVGNFQFQEKAVKFTQLLKTEYPSAWVVHDRIEPKDVPRQEIRVINERK